jgi:hypothetical protein
LPEGVEIVSAIKTGKQSLIPGLSLGEKGCEKDFGALHLQFEYFHFATNILVLCTIAAF